MKYVALVLCGLACVGSLYSFQRPFVAYPGVEYEDMPLPPDWQLPGEWNRPDEQSFAPPGILLANGLG